MKKSFEDKIDLEFDIYFEKFQKDNNNFKNKLFESKFKEGNYCFNVFSFKEGIIKNFKILNPDKNEFYFEFLLKKPAIYECSIFVNKKLINKKFLIEIKGNKKGIIEDDLRTNSESLFSSKSKISESINGKSFLKKKKNNFALQKNVFIHKKKKLIIKDKSKIPINPVKPGRRSIKRNTNKPKSVKKKLLKNYCKNKEILQQIFDKSKKNPFK